MLRSISRFCAVAFAVIALGSSGCGPDPKERMAMLEQENTQLSDELAQARSAAEQAARARDACEQELASLRSANDGLRNQLAAVPPPMETPEGWTAIPGGAMIALDGEVLFRSGKADLRPEAKSTLDAIAQVVNGEYGNKDVLVYGHTDGQPIKKSGWKDNLELSAQRAMAVVRYLQSKGVSPQRLVAGGCGEHRPRVSKSANEPKNRRVEIYVLENVAVSPTATAGR